MGHNNILGKIANPFSSPKSKIEFGLDPAGTVVRGYTGNPTTPRTMLDPGNAVWPKAADPVNYGNPGSFQQPAMQGPFIDPKTNMRAGAPVMPGQSQQSPMATSIGGLGGKNQIPMPPPMNAQPQQPQQRWGVSPIQPTGQQAM